MGTPDSRFEDRPGVQTYAFAPERSEYPDEPSVCAGSESCHRRDLGLVTYKAANAWYAVWLCEACYDCLRRGREVTETLSHRRV